MTFYTIGHSTTPLDTLVSLCRVAGVDLVCDVRRYPRSRRNPPFTRERLTDELPKPKHGLTYVWLGEELGGFRDGSYEEWMATPEFERGLLELERLAADHTVAFMCAEGQPWRCHRRFVARALVSRGHATAHLLPDGTQVWEVAQLELPGP